jgi:hypothetical protein
VFLRYAHIRLLGVGFTDGFFTFSCWGDRRRLMAYLAAAAVPRQEYELGCAKDMGRVLVLLCGGIDSLCGSRIGVLVSSINLDFEEGRSGWVGYHYTSL